MEEVPVLRDLDALFREVSLENPIALELCRVFYGYFSFIDDEIDLDGPARSAEEIARLGLESTLTWACNPLWLAHKAEFLPLLRVGAQSFLDSLDWSKREDPRERAVASWLKTDYSNALYYVAFLTGGPEHYAAITKKWRHCSWDAETGGPKPGAANLVSRVGAESAAKEKFAFLAEVVCRDADAQRWLTAYVRFCHALDDASERDVFWSPEEWVAVHLEWIEEVSTNPFFLQNKNYLLPLIISAARDWADSVAWEKRDSISDRRASQVLKSAYHSVVWAAAYLTGGYDHMTACTKKFRSIDYDIL